MQLSDWVGFAAAILTTASLWLVYGLLLGAWPIVIANLITLSLASAILLMKLKYHDDNPSE
jgi:MtN3 and saliva related transmembrane protein